MKVKNIKDAARKKTSKTAKVIDFKQMAKKKKETAEKLIKFQEVRTIARKMGIDTRNVTMTELIRAIQRTEGNKDCYKSAHVLTCEQSNCLWREYCVPF